MVIALQDIDECKDKMKILTDKKSVIIYGGENEFYRVNQVYHLFLRYFIYKYIDIFLLWIENNIIIKLKESKHNIIYIILIVINIGSRVLCSN